MESRGRYRCYDHRVRNAIVATKNPNLFPDLNIPRSTALDWIKKGPKYVITHSEFEDDQIDLVHRVSDLRSKLRSEEAKSTLLFKSARILGFELQYRRIPKSEDKIALIEAIQAAAEKIPIADFLEMLGLSAARFRAWTRKLRGCDLEDISSCPRSTPQQLTPYELSRIKFYATSESLAHFSIFALSWFAKKQRDIFASPATWSKVIRKLALRRPGKRLYPAKPKIGIRASEPCQIWHLDLSVIKLTDGSWAYIQAILDNFSRYILAWQVSSSCSGLKSAELIKSAIEQSTTLGIKIVPNVWVDTGSENINKDVDDLIETGIVSRTVVQIEVDESNSMIEALFHRAKNKFLYMKRLTDLETLRMHVHDYFDDSNHRIPHGSLKGATPLEIMLGKWGPSKIEQMYLAGQIAKDHRVSMNRQFHCTTCPI